MGIVGSNVDPHDKMRARDVNKVARGEQAPRPVRDSPAVSKPPPPSSADPRPKGKESKESEKEPGVKDMVSNGGMLCDLMRNCCIRYYEYYRCIQENHKDSIHCEKFADFYRVQCPYEWIQKWDEEREDGTFPRPL